MTNRRKFLVTVTTLCVTFALTIGTALAAELLGTVKSVDVDAKKITVTPKEGDDVVVSVKDDTEWANKKGKIDNFDLSKLKKGAVLEITHENNVASKVMIKKFGAGKKKNNN
jgi:hypothetical protein